MLIGARTGAWSGAKPTGTPIITTFGGQYFTILNGAQNWPCFRFFAKFNITTTNQFCGKYHSIGYSLHIGVRKSMFSVGLGLGDIINISNADLAYHTFEVDSKSGFSAVDGIRIDFTGRQYYSGNIGVFACQDGTAKCYMSMAWFEWGQNSKYLRRYIPYKDGDEVGMIQDDGTKFALAGAEYSEEIIEL